MNNTNCGPILHRFGETAMYRLKIAEFPVGSNAPARGGKWYGSNISMTLHLRFEYALCVPSFVPYTGWFLLYACWRRRTRRWWRNDPCHPYIGLLCTTVLSDIWLSFSCFVALKFFSGCNTLESSQTWRTRAQTNGINGYHETLYGIIGIAWHYWVGV